MFVLSFEAVSPAATLRVRTVGWMTAIEKALAQALSAGRDDGSVDGAIDPLEEARSIMDTAIGISYRWTLMPETVDLHDEIVRWRRRLERQYAGKRASG